MEVASFFVDFHHFLSIFTIFYRFSRFTHFFAIYALFPQFFLAKIAFPATSHVFCMYGTNTRQTKVFIITHRRDCQEPSHVEKDRSNYHLTSGLWWYRLAQKILITVPPHATPERICCRAPTFGVHNINTNPSPPRPKKLVVCPAPKQV